MAWYNLNKKQQTKPKKGSIKFSERFQQLFLQRVGIVNSYDNDVRIYIERGYQDNPIVYSIVNMVAKNAGRAEWCVRSKSTGEEVLVPLLNKPSNEYRPLMVQPNPLQTWRDMNQEVVTHFLLEGNGFITGEKGNGVNADKFSTLYSLPSEDMQIIADPGFRGIQGYRVDFAWSPDAEIPADEVLHIRNPNPDFDESDNWLFGQSNFRAARIPIQTYNESMETGLWFLQNKGSDKILYNKDPEFEMSPEGEDALKNKYRAQGQGKKNSGNVTFLDGIDLGVLDISSNAKEALVLEQRDQAGREICNVANFPHALAGYNDSTYQNAKEAKKALWENVVIPILDELKEGYNRWLIPGFGDDIYIDYKVDHIDALKEDRPVQEMAGIATVNEARRRIGMRPTKEGWGNDVYVGFTQSVVEDKPKDKPKPKK